MAAGYSVGIASETKAFKQGIDAGIIDPLEDAQKELKELGDSRGPEELEDGFREASRASEKLADETKRTARAIEEEFRDSYRHIKADAEGVGDGARRGFNRLGDAGEEVSGELRQNLGETLSSFRGDLEDLPQIAQDTLGGLAGSGALGGIPGLVATAAGAAGFGLLIGHFQDIKKEQEEAAQAARDWAQATIDSGSRVLDASSLIARSQEIYLDPDKYKEAQKNAENWGISEQDAVKAMAGDVAALELVQRSLNESLEEAKKAFDATDATDQQLRVQALTDRNNKGLKEGFDAYNQLKGAADDAGRALDRVSQLLLDAAVSAETAATEVDEVGNAVVTLPDGTQIFIDAETGIASQNIDRVKGELTPLEDGVQITVDAETGMAHVNLDALNAAADATNAKRPVVEADADTAAANADLDALNARQLDPKSATVHVNVDTSAWDNLTLGQKYGWVNTAISPSIARPFDG